MYMRHVCSWKHKSALEEMMDSEEPPYGVYLGQKLATGQERALTSTADNMLPKMDNQEQNKGLCILFPVSLACRRMALLQVTILVLILILSMFYEASAQNE